MWITLTAKNTSERKWTENKIKTQMDDEKLNEKKVENEKEKQ